MINEINICLQCGDAALRRGDPEHALRLFDHALALSSAADYPGKPRTLAGYFDNPDAHWARSVALLALGREEGFKEARARWEMEDYDNTAHKHLTFKGVPQWEGEPLEGKRLAIYNDMGFGDAIMALPHLPVDGLSVLIIQPELIGLAARFVNVATSTVIDAHFDYQASMFDFLTMPSAPREVPYIVPGEWKGELSARPKLGIAWSGRRTHARDGERSIPLHEFLPLLDHAYAKGWRTLKNDIEIHSLQNNGQHYAEHMGVVPHFFRDFSEVAALMQHMDMIITVDTAAANLAGAIAHPNAHVMLDVGQDWRWYQAERWYPTLKVHCQSYAGQWTKPFNELQRIR